MVHHHSVMLALLFAPQVSALGLQRLSASWVCRAESRRARSRNAEPAQRRPSQERCAVMHVHRRALVYSLV